MSTHSSDPQGEPADELQRSTAANRRQADPPASLPPEMQQFLRAVGAPNASSQVVARAVSATFSASPFPDGDELAKYNGVIEGGANRVMALVERQTMHRQAMERKALEADISLRKLGLVLAFLISLIAVIGGIGLVAAGNEIGALAALLPGIAGLAGVFVWWQKTRQSGPSLPPPTPPEDGQRER